MIAVAAPAGAQSQQGEAAKTRTIGVYDNYYSPDNVTVKRGTKVKWVWKNTYNWHNVKVRSGPTYFKSKKKKTGSFTKKLSKAGVYQIYCTVHPTYHKMQITVN